MVCTADGRGTTTQSQFDWTTISRRRRSRPLDEVLSPKSGERQMAWTAVSDQWSCGAAVPPPGVAP